MNKMVIVLSACLMMPLWQAFARAPSSGSASSKSNNSLTITSPASNASVSGVIKVSGAIGSEFVNVAAYDASNTDNKIAQDVTPSKGAYTLSVDTTKLANGSYTIAVIAFNQPAGVVNNVVSKEVNVTVSINNNATPPPPPPPTQSSNVPFYGVNGHYIQGGIYATNIAQQVADMKAMGVTSIRQDCYSTSDTATMAGLVKSFSPIMIQPIFNVYPATNANETTTYNQFYAYGQTVAGQLAGKVKVIELMNEPENQYFSSVPAANGQSVTNWSASNSQWPALRGAVRGFYAGFRSVDTTKQTLIASPSVGWLHYGLLEGLWTGEAPNGSTGNPKATWDITNYHWYYDMGDIENAGGVNTLSVLKSEFSLPIMLTEVGVQNSVSSSVYNSYVGSAIAEYAGAAASTYNIIGIDWYELYNFDNNGGFYMGLYNSPGVVNGGRAAAMTSAISANPAP